MGALVPGPSAGQGRIAPLPWPLPVSPPPAPRTPPRPAGSPAGWQVLLAGLSLILTALVWLNGLVGSLERPSVGNALAVRQLQLEVQAAPALPPQWRPWLIRRDPRAALAEALQSALDGTPGPGGSDPVLQLALLRQDLGEVAAADALLQELAIQVPPERRPLLQALASTAPAQGSVPGPAPQEASWQPLLSPLTRQLLCERLPGQGDCDSGAAARQAVLRLLGLSWLPGLLLLLGVGLLLRQAWLLWRRRPTAPPLVGPRLNLVDVTLLIAGGFVVLGEVMVPLVLAPVSEAVLAPLAAAPIRQQSLQVLLLYGGLMLPPLAILRAQLGGGSGAPAGGWLQWRWRPLGSALAAGLGQTLMILPVVALSGWLVERLAGDPGGSNPLLELVLTAGDPLALVGFALTATVLAPLFEETLFRGVLLPVLGQRWGPLPAVVVSALVFGLAHLSLGELVPLVVLGLGLGWLRWRSGRLAPCVLMHACWNGLTFLNLVLLAG